MAIEEWIKQHNEDVSEAERIEALTVRRLPPELKEALKSLKKFNKKMGEAWEAASKVEKSVQALEARVRTLIKAELDKPV